MSEIAVAWVVISVACGLSLWLVTSISPWERIEPFVYSYSAHEYGTFKRKKEVQ